MSQKKQQKIAARKAREEQQGKKVIAWVTGALLVVAIVTITLFALYL
ncbi:MAG: hypothetical protein NC388_09060 [Clostridium sp.]|nr:hypothetical protein [Clostridium sp.]